MSNKTLISLILVVIVIALIIIGWGASRSNPPITQPNSLPATSSGQANKIMSPIITLDTSLGEIQFETYTNDAPNTVANFVKLAQAGYYDGLNFHRVIKDFMIQGGDPNCSPELSKTPATGPCGTGGPGYEFADELNPDTASYKAGYQKGVVAMANAGPNTNGSQFFIMLADNPLPNAYTIFGKVIKGQEVVDKIGEVKTDDNDRPTTPVIIKKVTISN
ncbi:MAG: peptidylprolyl isomerase [Candidatus Paceibacterota bacterium]|jgi:cyclophilin family peptidyl-prolyl cis-trans isomerase